jgi:hypothetical protein
MTTHQPLTFTMFLAMFLAMSAIATAQDPSDVADSSAIGAGERFFFRQH